jgi:hypothetical protein
VTAVELVRDVLARLVSAREEFDHAVLDQLLEDLEHDLAAWLAQYEELAA